MLAHLTSFRAVACVLLVSVAAAGALAVEPADLPDEVPAGTAAPAPASVAVGVEPANDEAPAGPNLRPLAPVAGAVGSIVGVGVGGAAGLAATWGVWGLISAASAASSAGWVHLVLGLAQLASPVVLVALPAIGAGLGAFAGLALVTDTASAAAGGVVAAVATPVGAVGGTAAGAALGVAAGVALVSKSGSDPYAVLVVLALGFGGGVLGAGVGGLAGATAGGAIGGFVAGAE